MPMLGAMATSVLASALRRARDSWRGQLGVLAVGSLLLGFIVVAAGATGVDLGLRAAIGAIVMLVLFAASIRAGYDEHDDITTDVMLDELYEVAKVLPRLVAQVGIVALPVVVVTSATLQLAGALPLVGLALMPVAFAVWAAAAPAMLLAAAAVVHGDRDWLPRTAVRAVRARPGTLILATLVGMVVASIAALPLVLVGLVFTAIAGWLGLLGAGLACASVVPWMGCWALALWTEIGAVVHQEQTVEDPPADAFAAAMQPAAPALTSHAPEDAPWVEGPSWDVAVEPGAVWGTWVRVEATAHVAFRLTWSGIVAPRLALGAEDGTWTSPGIATSQGDAIPAVLPAGNTYVQLASTDAAAQSISVTMLVRGAAAA